MKTTTRALHIVVGYLRELGYEARQRDDLVLATRGDDNIVSFLDEDTQKVFFEAMICTLSNVPKQHLANFILSCLNINRAATPATVCITMGDDGGDPSVLASTSVRYERVSIETVCDAIDALLRVIPNARRIMEATT